MNHKLQSLVLGLLPFMLLGSTAAHAESLLGNWQCQGPDGQHNLNFRNSNTLIYDNETLSYGVMGDVLMVQEEYGATSYGYQQQGKQLWIQLPDGSMLNCRRASAQPAEQVPQAPATPATGQVSSAELQAQIAGTWWGYSGSTERKIGLCPDGSYMDYTESSYSGRGYDSGGNESMAWGAAGQAGRQGRWSIQGNYQQGTISVQTRGGNFSLQYSQVGEPGCLNINGSRLCRSSASCE